MSKLWSKSLEATQAVNLTKFSMQQHKIIHAFAWRLNGYVLHNKMHFWVKITPGISIQNNMKA